MKRLATARSALVALPVLLACHGPADGDWSGTCTIVDPYGGASDVLDVSFTLAGKSEIEGDGEIAWEARTYTGPLAGLLDDTTITWTFDGTSDLGGDPLQFGFGGQLDEEANTIQGDCATYLGDEGDLSLTRAE